MSCRGWGLIAFPRRARVVRIYESRDSSLNEGRSVSPASGREKEEEVEEGLRGLGLTNYESRAYVSLFSSNDLDADSLSRMSGVSPSRIYDTLSSLSRKGMVTVINSKPKRYHAVEIEAAVGALVLAKEGELQKGLDDLRTMELRTLEKAKQVARVGNGPLERSSFVGILSGKSSLENWMRGALRTAKKELIVFGGDLDWSDHDIMRLKMLAKKGVKVRILANVGKRNAATVRDLIRGGVDVRERPRYVELRGLVFDDKVVYISNKVLVGSGAPRPKVRDYNAFITNSLSLAKSLRDYFGMVWDSAPVRKI